MKIFPVVIMISFCFIQEINCQENPRRNIEFGIDIKPVIIWASGGDLPSNGIEIIYRELNQNKEFRFKFTSTTYNFLGEELIANRLIKNNKPSSLEYFYAEYLPKNSYLLSGGISKKQFFEKQEIYYGIDINLGISRGRIRTELREIFLTEQQVSPLNNYTNNLFIAGFTPVVGIKQDLNKRVALGIEFGPSINISLGELEYENELGDQINRRVEYLDLNFKQLINDIAILIRI